MSAVMCRPSIVRTFIQLALIAKTAQVVQPNLTPTRSERVADDPCLTVTQLSTDNVSLFPVPFIVTYSSPLTHPENFNSALIGRSSSR